MKIVITLLAAIAVATASPIGSEKCTYGPTYWCSGVDAATACNAMDYCVSKGLLQAPTTAAAAPASLLGGEKCTQGPSYWCSGFDTASACNAMDYCVTQGLLSIPASESVKAVGGEKCLQGPSYWCSSSDAATACDTMDYCVSKGLLASPTATLVGGEKCTQGPSYWCSGYDTATACNATDYCVSKGLLAPAPDNGLECTVCTLLIQAVDDYLKENSTESDIISALEDVCKILPSDDQASCQQFIQDEGDELINAIVNELDPSDVCSALGVCLSKTAVAAVAPVVAVEPATVKDSECSVCMLVISTLQSFLEQNSTQADILQEVEKVCTDLGALESLCDDFINDYGSKAIDYLAKELDPTTICDDLGLCSASAGATGTMVGSKCTEGPAYWCQTVDTANECNTLTLCQQKIWNASEPAM